MCNRITQFVKQLQRPENSLFLYDKSFIMYTLNASDFDKQFESIGPNLTYNDSDLLAWFYETALGKYVVYRRTLSGSKKIYTELNKLIKSYQRNQLEIEDPKSFAELMGSLINEHAKLLDDFKESDLFTRKQNKKVILAFNEVINKMIRLQSISIKENIKGKPKLDDSRLINMIMNHNSIELQKQSEFK